MSIEMATTCVGAAGLHKQESVGGVPPVPPGFASLTSFTLERVQDDGAMASASCSSDSQSSRMGSVCRGLNVDKCRESLQRRPWINHGRIDNSDEEESEFEVSYHDVPSINPLKKGVLRGCVDCANCQKVIARWHPEDGCRPILDEAPVFYPNEEEFKDTLKYIATIRPTAEQYGICRIVPPSSWKPPCPLMERVNWENRKFPTRKQCIDKLQNRCSVRQMARYCRSPNRKKQRLLELGEHHLHDNGNFLKYDGTRCDNIAEMFGFESGPEFTLEAFQDYADYFKEQYFCMEDQTPDDKFDQNNFERECKPSVEDIEGEYWRIVEKPTEAIEVLYGADVETKVFGSGFPKASTDGYDSEDEYVTTGWNLNNSPRLPGSMLSFESADISGVLVPWLYVGMCFSSFCWHVEDHHFYSLNYMHCGAPKIWYGVPGRAALKHEAAMRKHLPGLFEGQPDLLHKLVTQFSPSTLKLEGVPVYRCVQHSGEFVVTFARAYHSGFNCGFNCAEAVNVAPIDWLPHGQNVVELYRDQRRKISISHDKLLLGAANEAVRAQWNISFLRKLSSDCLLWKDACGHDKFLSKAFKSRLEVERSRREFLCSSSQSRKMDAGFDSNTERECFFCHYDLHLSAVSCSCSTDKFACLNHAKKMCSCDWRSRTFLFRYDISEMNVLLDALDGKLSAVHKWGVSHLGLSLSSYVKKDKPHGRNLASYSSTEEKLKEKLKCSLSGLSTSNIQNYETEIQKGEAQMQSVTNRPLNEEGMVYQTSRVMEGCSSSSSDSLSRAGSQCSGQESLDIRLEITYCKEQNLVGHLPPVTKVNPSTKLIEKEKLISGEDAHMVQSCDKESRAPFRLLNETSLNYYDRGQKLIIDDGKTSSSSHQNHLLGKTKAPMMSEEEVDLHPPIGTPVHPSSPHLNVNGQEKVEILRYSKSMSADAPLSTSLPHEDSLNTVSDSGSTANPVQKLLVSNQVGDSDTSTYRNISVNSNLSGSDKANDESKHGRIGSHSVGNLTDGGQTDAENPFNPLNANGKYCQQKGPHIARMVQRINYTVEPLSYGVILPGRLWSNSRNIFPKGYRSRISYFSILDPSQMCYYVSQILDAGHLGPLFVVQPEHVSSEVFIHISATKCWDSVRERVNKEITRQHSFGKFNVPTLQPPKSVDGLEMFGLSSPEIIQAIEAIDKYHVCSEYWKSRSQTSTGDLGPSVREEHGFQDTSLPGSATILQGLLMKANPEELLTLHAMLRSDEPSSKEEVIQLVHNEVEKRPIL